MEKEEKKIDLKPIVGILIVLLGVSLFYTYKFKKRADQLIIDNNDLTTQVTNVKTEKQAVLDSLSVLKNIYDQALTDKGTISEELRLEQEKVVNLIREINKSKGDVNSIAAIKRKYEDLKEKFDLLTEKNEEIKKLNEKLVTERDNAETTFNNQKKSIDTLATQNNKLREVVDRASRLVVINSRAFGIKEKKSGEQVDTKKASKTNKIKVCFTVAANEVAKSGEKTYYVQIIDPKETVLGDKKTEYFGSKSVEYSFVSKVIFKNQAVEVCEFLDSNNVPFEKGEYTVSVYEKADLVSKTNLMLK